MTATLVRSTLSCKKEKAEEPVPKPRCRRSLIREEKAKERRSAKPPLLCPLQGMPCPVFTVSAREPSFPGVHRGEGEERHQEAMRWKAVALHRPCLSQEGLMQQGLILPAKGTWTPPPRHQPNDPPGWSFSTDRPRYLQHREIKVLVKDVQDRFTTADVLEEPERLHTFLRSLMNLGVRVAPSLVNPAPPPHKFGARSST